MLTGVIEYNQSHNKFYCNTGGKLIDVTSSMMTLLLQHKHQVELDMRQEFIAIVDANAEKAAIFDKIMDLMPFRGPTT